METFDESNVRNTDVRFDIIYRRFEFERRHIWRKTLRNEMDFHHLVGRVPRKKKRTRAPEG